MQGEFISSRSGKGFAALTVHFPHDLTTAEQERAGAELAAIAEEEDQPVVVLDLSEMEAAYSRFLGAFLSLLRRQHERGGRLLLAGVRPLVAQTLELCALDVLFETFPTVEAALTAAGVEPG